MAYPEWAGPFGVPTTKEELILAIATSGFLFGVGYGVREAHAGYTLARMPDVRWRNIVFDRQKLLKLARRNTTFPSIGNAVSIYGRMLLRSPATLPLVASLGLMYVGAKARPTDEDVWQTDRIQRARAQAMGARDPYGVGTGPWFVSHGYFHDSPHHGDHWYSFNPQDIDGSHR